MTAGKIAAIAMPTTLASGISVGLLILALFLGGGSIS